MLLFSHFAQLINQMNLRVISILLFAGATLLSCEDNSSPFIKGDWARISDDVYTEFHFGDSIVESFSRDFELQYVFSYKMINDSIIIGDKRSSIKIINDSILKISDSANSIEYHRVFNNGSDFLLSDLIETGAYNRKFGDEEFQRILTKYLDSNFTIREAKYRIAKGLVNKDSLLAFWESKALSDSSENSYWKYLIKNCTQ